MVFLLSNSVPTTSGKIVGKESIGDLFLADGLFPGGIAKNVIKLPDLQNASCNESTS